uniref:Uncharacterized protein n=1 Tax=Glossina palpalis gambiensis TaxID=67801 RepID=A0A1B0BJ11_9MUSC
MYILAVVVVVVAVRFVCYWMCSCNVMLFFAFAQKCYVKNERKKLKAPSMSQCVSQSLLGSIDEVIYIFAVLSFFGKLPNPSQPLCRAISHIEKYVQRSLRRICRPQRTALISISNFRLLKQSYPNFENQPKTKFIQEMQQLEDGLRENAKF